MERRRFVAGLGGAGLLAAGSQPSSAQQARTRRHFVLATGHDAMITAPGPLADMLLEIAG